MKKLIIELLILLTAALAPVALFAQDDATKPVVVGGFENTGSATTGPGWVVADNRKRPRLLFIRSSLFHPP